MVCGKQSEHTKDNTAYLFSFFPVNLSGYLVLMSKDPQLPDREWTVDSIVSDRLSATVGPLQSNITYFFKIQARNNIGYGPHSDILHYRIGQMVPTRDPMMPGSQTAVTPPSFTGK